MIIFSDPHLGVRRNQNTTPASRQRLMDAGFEAVESIFHTFGDTTYICGGDLFDSYSNPEAVIARAWPLAENIDWCLAGNHDLVNIEGKVGSLQLMRMKELAVGERSRFCYTPFGSAEIHQRTFPVGRGEVEVCAIPHVADQALFDVALQTAYQSKLRRPVLKRYLLLHCNYDNPMARETDLNLTYEAAEQLLEVYDYVLLGHEHEPREDFDDRLIVIGNTFPTSFADVSNKRVIEVQEDGTPASHPLWSQAERHLARDWQTMAELPTESLADCQFLRLTGAAEATQLVELSRLTRRLWAECPELLALKVDVEVAGIQRTVNADGQLDRLPEIIARELDGSPLKGLWDELWKEETDVAELSRKAG